MERDSWKVETMKIVPLFSWTTKEWNNCRIFLLLLLVVAITGWARFLIVFNFSSFFELAVVVVIFDGLQELTNIYIYICVNDFGVWFSCFHMYFTNYLLLLLLFFCLLLRFSHSKCSLSQFVYICHVFVSY